MHTLVQAVVAGYASGTPDVVALTLAHMTTQITGQPRAAEAYTTLLMHCRSGLRAMERDGTGIIPLSLSDGRTVLGIRLTLDQRTLLVTVLPWKGEICTVVRWLDRYGVASPRVRIPPLALREVGA